MKNLYKIGALTVGLWCFSLCTLGQAKKEYALRLREVWECAGFAG